MFLSFLPQLRVCVYPIPPNCISEEQLTLPTALSEKYLKQNEKVHQKASERC